MQNLAIATCILLLFLWLGCVVDFPMHNNAQAIDRHFALVADDWRRTADGWEKVSSWDVLRPDAPLPIASRLHPGLLAGFQLLFSVGSLLAFTPNTSNNGTFREEAASRTS